MNCLQTFFTNKWYKGHHNITLNSGRALKMDVILHSMFIISKKKKFPLQKKKYKDVEKKKDNIKI